MGCTIAETGSGRLALRFRWTGQDGRRHRFSVTTELDATSANRATLEPRRMAIAAEIRAGTFDPLRHFRGVRWPFGMGPRQPEQGGALADRLAAWIDRVDRPNVRRSRIRDYRSHLKNYFRQHRIGTLDASTLADQDAAAFQRWLVTKKPAGAGVSEKTAANVIRGTLRAFLLAIKASVEPLDALSWERYVPTRRQNPFEPAELELIFAWFKARSFKEYTSLLLRYRGLRPSEVRGLQVGDFARRTSTLTIARSRNLGHVAATKTARAGRVITLDAATAEAVATLVGIRKPEEPLLSLAEDTLRDHFTACLRALGLAHRELYQLKHSAAINRILAGENQGEIARDFGITGGTFEKHYAWTLPIIAEIRARASGMDQLVQPASKPG